MLLAKESYFINPAFARLLENPGKIEARILTNGPKCLVEKVFPQLQEDRILDRLDEKSAHDISQFSDIHVGTDLRHNIPQTRFLITRKKNSILSPNITVFPKLTDAVMSDILSSIS